MCVSVCVSYKNRGPFSLTIFFMADSALGVVAPVMSACVRVCVRMCVCVCVYVCVCMCVFVCVRMCVS
jgi:hypothetical protein